MCRRGMLLYSSGKLTIWTEQNQRKSWSELFKPHEEIGRRARIISLAVGQVYSVVDPLQC